MSSLKIINNVDGETVGVMPLCNKESTLAELRLEIEDDFEIKGFAFERAGSLVNFCEEATTTVSSVGLDNVDEATDNDFFVIAILKCSRTAETADNEKKPLDICATTQHQGKESASCSTPSTAILRSPKAWEIRGVKIYTQHEIETAKGMEKRRRMFWNERAKKLCIQTKKSKCDLIKAVEVAWREHQATLLLHEESLLSRIQDDVRVNAAPGQQKICKPGTIQKNANRIRQLVINLDQVNKDTSGIIKSESGIGKKRKLNELEERKKCLLSEMKKAQDVMRKNLKTSMGLVKDLTNTL